MPFPFEAIFLNFSRLPAFWEACFGIESDVVDEYSLNKFFAMRRQLFLPKAKLVAALNAAQRNSG